MSTNHNSNDSSFDETKPSYRLESDGSSSNSNEQLPADRDKTNRVTSRSGDSAADDSQPRTEETITFVGPSTEPTPATDFSISDLTSDQIGGEATVIRKSHSSELAGNPSRTRSLASNSILSVAEQLVGQQLDHLHLESLVASGGMGAVFKGRDTQLDRVVAVKVIPEANRDADSQRRFRTEAQAAAKLDHPNIARIYYVGKSEQWNYIVLEFVDGTNLRDWVALNGPMSIDDTVFVIRQIAEALEHAFKRGVVHRDIKPSNVLLTSEGVAKVVDMGLARDATANRRATDETSSGTTLGTFDYISPEQAKDPRQADIRSDLYSLGCTMYYCLLGRPPFQEGTALQKLLSHGTDLPPDPRKDRPDVSRELHAILYRLMAKVPSDRYQRPSDLASDLTRLAEIEGLDKSRRVPQKSIASGAAVATPFERALPWLAGVIAILVIAIWLVIQTYFASDSDLSQATGTRSADVASESVVGIDDPDSGSSAIVDDGNAKPDAIGPAAGSPSIDSKLSNATDSTVEELANESTLATESVLAVRPEVAESDSSDRTQIAEPSLGANENQSTSANQPVLRDNEATKPLAVDTVWIVPSTTPANRVVINSAQQITASTFEEAIRLANSDQRLVKILVAADSINVSPLEIRSSKLSIAAAPNFEPVLNWFISQPKNTQPNTAQPGVSIPLIAAMECELSWERINFNIKDRSREESERTKPLNHTVFSLQGSSMIMRNCAVTVERSRWVESASSLKPISIIQIGASLSGSRSVDSPASSSIRASKDALVKLSLRNCIFRGDANGIEFPTAVRSELDIENCLIAMRNHFIQLGGSKLSARSRSTIRVDMNDSTVAVGQRFAKVEFNSRQSRRVFLRRESKRCVFWSPSNSALVELIGFSDISQAEDMLLLTGEDNVYDANMVAVVDLVDQTGSKSRLKFEEAESSLFRDKAFETSVRWQNPPASIMNFSRTLPDDYAQIDGKFKPGPDLTRLPKLDY